MVDTSVVVIHWGLIATIKQSCCDWGLNCYCKTEKTKAPGFLNSRSLLSLATIFPIHNSPLVIITIKSRILIRLAFKSNLLFNRSRCIVSHGFVYQCPIWCIVVVSREITPFQDGVWGYLSYYYIIFDMSHCKIFDVWWWWIKKIDNENSPEQDTVALHARQLTPAV